jgi:hypothetical protein
LLAIRIFDELQLSSRVVVIVARLVFAIDRFLQITLVIVDIFGGATEGIGFGQEPTLRAIGINHRLIEMIGFGEFVALGVVGVGGGVAFERCGIGVVGAIADDGFGE